MTEVLDRYSKKYPVHRESYDYCASATLMNLKQLHQYSLEEARQTFKELNSVQVEGETFDGEVLELNISSASLPEGIPASVYKPSNLATSSPILVYFHGSGLVVLDWKCFERPLKKVATATGCIIVNVEYRLLPYPGKGHDPFDDAVAATKWVLENREKVGGRSDSPVGVAGDSAGGQIAATVSIEVRDLDFQVLVYPNLDLSLQQPSVEEFADAPLLGKADLECINKYIAQALPDYLNDPRANTIIHPDVASSPPTLVILAQLDPIRDSGVAYAERLRAAGVRVEVVIIEGVLHGFFTMPEVFKTTTAQAWDHVARFVRDFKAPPS